MNIMEEDGTVVEVPDDEEVISELPPTGYDLERETFDIYMDALRLKCIDEDIDMRNTPAVFEVMRRWWFIMSDIDACKKYCEDSHKLQLETQKTGYRDAIKQIDKELKSV